MRVKNDDYDDDVYLVMVMMMMMIMMMMMMMMMTMSFLMIIVKITAHDGIDFSHRNMIVEQLIQSRYDRLY